MEYKIIYEEEEIKELDYIRLCSKKLIDLGIELDYRTDNVIHSLGEVCMLPTINRLSYLSKLLSQIAYFQLGKKINDITVGIALTLFPNHDWKQVYDLIKHIKSIELID